MGRATADCADNINLSKQTQLWTGSSRRMSENWSLGNSYCLFVLTLSYILGEIAHFLINTTAREVARDIHFGEEECYFNETVTELRDDNNCSSLKTLDQCHRAPHCYWSWSGQGYQYQVLAGPAFIAVFSVSGVLLSVMSDQLKHSISRVVLIGLGTATFSSACLLMGLSSSYWQLVVLRMMISAGESVC